MENEELLQELKENFQKMKTELGFKSTFEEIDKIFFIKDNILGEKFVSGSLSRQICSRMAALYSNWSGYLHSLLMPNPQNILNFNESKLFDHEEKKGISNLISVGMEIMSRNSLIGLTKDKAEEAKFIDDAVKVWNTKFEKGLIKIMQKVNSAWGEE